MDYKRSLAATRICKEKIAHCQFRQMWGLGLAYLKLGGVLDRYYLKRHLFKGNNRSSQHQTLSHLTPLPHGLRRQKSQHDSPHLECKWQLLNTYIAQSLLARNLSDEACCPIYLRVDLCRSRAQFQHGIIVRDEEGLLRTICGFSSHLLPGRRNAVRRLCYNPS